MKITEQWLDTHSWMLRSSNNGKSYGDFKWPKIGEWIECPDWNNESKCGHGFHGITPEYNGFGFIYSRLELVEYAGEVVAIDNNKVKVRKARIVAINNNIPEIAFERCGYKVAHDGDTISPQYGKNWLILKGNVTVTSQTGGACSFHDDSRGTITSQSGGYCNFLGNSRGTVISQSGGYCNFYNNSRGTVTNQSSGYCHFLDNSRGTVTSQSSGYCRFYGNSKGSVTSQANAESGGVK